MRKKSIERRRLGIFVSVLCATVSVSTASSASEWVSYLEGTWVGTGTGKSGPDENGQKIKCRFRGMAESESRVSFNGRCASTRKRGSISMTLIAKPDSSFSGFANSIFSKKKLSYIGESKNGSISITATQPIVRDEGRFASRITITQSGAKGLEFIEELRNLDTGQQFISVSTEFQKR